MYAEADDTVARRGAEHGVAATEYIGVVIVVAVLVAALVSAVTPGVPAAVVDGITGAVGQMVDGEAPGATARPAPTGRDLAATDQLAAEEATMTVMGHSYGATALGHDAGRVWGVRHDKDPIALAWMHGRNPDAPAFGANGFTVGDGTSNVAGGRTRPLSTASILSARCRAATSPW